MCFILSEAAKFPFAGLKLSLVRRVWICLMCVCLCVCSLACAAFLTLITFMCLTCV